MKYSVGKPAEDPDNTKYTPWLIRDASRVAIAFFQPSVLFCFGKGPPRKKKHLGRYISRPLVQE